ncbi:MAG: hypothetical protein ACFE7R_09340, partial [Candidatus Hodarchaeota archaeon]
ISVSAILSGVLSKVQGAPITLIVFDDDEVVWERTLITNMQGRVETNIEGLLAGEYTLDISYSGSDRYAACVSQVHFQIQPVVLASISQITDPHVGSNVTAEIEYSIQGVIAEWTGQLGIAVIGPRDEIVTKSNLSITSGGSILIMFTALEVGLYSLNLTIYGLPVVGEELVDLIVDIGEPPSILSIDAGSTPLFSGIGAIVVIGLILRRRLDRIAGSLPAEWGG